MIREALISAMLNNKSGNGESASDVPDVRRIKKDWNSFLSWMESKGVKGKDTLDKGGLGNQYFKEYIKLNPETSLNESVIPIIRGEYKKLRDDNVADILAGKGEFNLPGIGKLTGEPAKKYIDRFMGHILANEKSENPNYVGQHLTQTYFPPATEEVYVDDKLVSKKTVSEYGVGDIEKLRKSASNSPSTQKTTVVTKIPLKNTPILNTQKQ